MKFNIIGQGITNPAWDGSGTTLKQYDSVTMPQTPTGSMILAYWNVASQNNDGSLSWTTGASGPQFLDAPAMPLIPSTLVQNFQGNNLTVTNLSGNAETPIRIAAFAPGIPKQTPRPLTVGGPPVQLSTLQAAQGKAPPNWAQLTFQNNSSNQCIMAVIGGPLNTSGNNVQFFAVNYDGPAPPGYTKVTAGNTLSLSMQWQTLIYVANLSPSTSSSVAVSLINL